MSISPMDAYAWSFPVLHSRLDLFSNKYQGSLSGVHQCLSLSSQSASEQVEALNEVNSGSTSL